MARIERRIKQAFTNAVPDVQDSVLQRCAEMKGQVKDTMTDYANNMENRAITKKSGRKIIVKAALIATAVMILTVSAAAAVSLSGLQPKEEAEVAVLNHAVMNCSDEDMKNDLAAVVLSGMECTTESELAFSGIRPVYKTKTVIGGFTITSTVDAKTLVILDSSVEYDEELMEQAVENERKKPAVVAPNYPDIVAYPAYLQPVYILRDHYGLIDSESLDIRTNYYWCEYDESHENIHAFANFDGYRYEGVFNAETLEMISTTVTEIEDYVGEKALHEKTEGYISMVDAVKLVGDDLGIDIWKITADKTHADRANPISLLYASHQSMEDGVEVAVRVVYDDVNYDYRLSAANGEVLKKYAMLDMDYTMEKCAEHFGVTSRELGMYHVGNNVEYLDMTVAGFTLSTDGKTYKVIFDNETKQIVSAEEDKKDPENLGTRNIYTLSTEAPDGMISEAEAAAIALERFEFSISQARDDFRLKLDGNVYSIAWAQQTHCNFDHVMIKYSCSVDAKTGAVISSTPKLIHADLSETSGFIGEEKAKELAEAYDQDGREKIAKITDVTLGEMCISASDSELEYTAVYQVNFDYKGRDGEVWFYAVDAKTGEVYGALGNGLYK